MYCILKNVCNRGPRTLLTQQRFVKIIPTGQANVVDETFEEKNGRLRRPLSPHLSIYKPQITSMLSITHRITGVALFGYTVAIAGFGYFEYTDEAVLYLRSLELSPATWIAIKTVVATPFTFHFANGIRHLAWDTGAMLNNKGVNISGYGVAIITLISALYLASLSL